MLHAYMLHATWSPNAQTLPEVKVMNHPSLLYIIYINLQLTYTFIIKNKLLLEHVAS